MPQHKIALLAIVIALCFPYAERLNAQTVGYAEAVGQLAVSCGNDIDKLCKKTNLGGGRMMQCLEQNHASVSSQCKASIAAMATLLKKRALARASVMRICDPDIKRLCAGIQAGDGNLMECFDKARSRFSAACRQAVSDAGFDVSLATGPVTDQIHLESNDILSSLHGVEAAAANIDAASLRRLANESLQDSSRANRMNRAPLSEELSNHAQLTVAIQFDFDAARVRPNSFRAVGLIADALNHPYLQGYCFLVVGHTDAKGSREYNLKLSQQRADAIREALINPFGINPARIEAVGLGEEQLLTPTKPDAAENRRVQLINIGTLNGGGQCSH